MVCVAVVCEDTGVGLVDLEVMLLELDSSFGDGFLFGTRWCGGVDFRWNGLNYGCNRWFLGRYQG